MQKTFFKNLVTLFGGTQASTSTHRTPKNTLRILSLLMALAFLFQSAVPAFADNRLEKYKLAVDSKLDEIKFLAVWNALTSLSVTLETIKTSNQITEEQMRAFVAVFKSNLQTQDTHYGENLRFSYYRSTGSIYIYSTNPRNGPGVVYCICPKTNTKEDPIIGTAEKFGLINGKDSVGEGNNA